MEYGYSLDQEQGIYVEKISWFDYRKQAPTSYQRRKLEKANPHLYDNTDIPVPGSGESGHFNRTPAMILLEQGLIVERDGEEHQITMFHPVGIAKKFSQLKSANDILNFANEYGLLGCKLVENTHVLDSPMDYIKRFSYHQSYFEPIKVWEWHIDHVKKLFQLYRALRYKTNIENDLLRVEVLPDEPLPSGASTPAYGLIYWNDGKLADYYMGVGAVDYNKIARTVLVSQLSKMLKGAIDLDRDSIADDESSELGFRLNETRRTRFLLAAIYYDMWNTIKNHHAVSVCEHCDASFTPNRRRKFCSDACKQAAYRKNREGVKENG